MKDCNQCGKCCTHYSNGGLFASESEINFWDIFRTDIYQYVNDGKIWMDPQTGRQLSLCPWLRKQPDHNIYTCDIYDDRPDDCKHYPVTIEQMILDDCEMLEQHDLLKPAQAQKSLNKIMLDSRPAYE